MPSFFQFQGPALFLLMGSERNPYKLRINLPHFTTLSGFFLCITKAPNEYSFRTEIAILCVSYSNFLGLIPAYIK